MSIHCNKPIHMKFKFQLCHISLSYLKTCTAVYLFNGLDIHINIARRWNLKQSHVNIKKKLNSKLVVEINHSIM